MSSTVLEPHYISSSTTEQHVLFSCIVSSSSICVWFPSFDSFESWTETGKNKTTELGQDMGRRRIERSTEIILYAIFTSCLTATLSSTEIKLVGLTVCNGLSTYILIRKWNTQIGAGIVGMVITSSKWFSLQSRTAWLCQLFIHSKLLNLLYADILNFEDNVLNIVLKLKNLEFIITSFSKWNPNNFSLSNKLSNFNNCIIVALYARSLRIIIIFPLISNSFRKKITDSTLELRQIEYINDYVKTIT